MQEKINNYELVLDLYFQERINKSQLKKAFDLIRMDLFKNITFENFGHKILINKKEVK